MAIKTFLYTTFYNEKDDFRRSELLDCIRKNLMNANIDNVVLLNEGDSITSEFNTYKLTEIFINKRPTYQDFIAQIKKKDGKDGIHIIANTDIYFDQTIGVLPYLNLDNKCFALSRWDILPIGKAKLYNHNDSQDVWIFKGPIKDSLKADYPIGVPRCDNRFMYDLQKAGYELLNPAFSIKCYHLHHKSNKVPYTDEDNKYNIQPPYRYKYPHNLYGLPKTISFNLTNEFKLGRYRYDIKKMNLWLLVRIFRKIMEWITGNRQPLIGY